MKSKAALALVLGLACMQLPAGAAEGGRNSGIDAAVETARAYVHTHVADFGVTAADIADLAVTDAYRSDDNGVTYVYLQQHLNQRPVNEANMTVGVSRDGNVFHTASRFIGDLATKASGAVVLTHAVAFADAARALSATAPRETAAPKIVYQPADGRLRLAWNLEMQVPAGDHWWNVAVDAETGALLAKYDYVVHDERAVSAASTADTGEDARRLIQPTQSAGPGNDGASYRVYALPLESPNDGGRTLVTNPALPSASPFGWQDTNGVPGPEFTRTTGNNVDAAWDPTGPANGGQFVDAFHAEGGPSLTFDHPIDPTAVPVTYKDAAVTNLYYWNNIIHDVFYGYGFDERSGNFQQNQYDKWIIGERDPVQADAQDGGGVNNANFGTPPDGRSPRMQMFIWNAGRRTFDGDVDAGVIAHEYGHGISNRLTGGPNNTSCLGNAEQGGEGWSDFLAMALTVRPGDKGTDNRGIGTYVSGQTGRKSVGIRPTAYKSPSSSPNYDYIKANAEVHAIGYVWAEMLWDVFWEITNAHGLNPDVYGAWNTGGNNRAIQLVMDGMKLQPCSPGFVDSRDGILAADMALTGGVDRCRIWAAFARHGLGFSANQGSAASATDGTQAFDKPAGC